MSGHRAYRQLWRKTGIDQGFSGDRQKTGIDQGFSGGTDQRWHRSHGIVYRYQKAFEGAVRVGVKSRQVSGLPHQQATGSQSVKSIPIAWRVYVSLMNV